MLELTTYTELEIAHRLLTSYSEKCHHIHGHRYEVSITVASNGSLNADNMIVDFKKLKSIVKYVLDDEWDHGACFHKDDPLVPSLLSDSETKRLHIIDANPTLEWMAENWGEKLQEAFGKEGLSIRLVRLTASETAKNTVTYEPVPIVTVSGLPGTIMSTPVNDTPATEDAPDAVPYVCAYKGHNTIGTALLYSSLRGEALYFAAQEKVAPAVLTNITRLPT